MELIRGLHNLQPRHSGCVATIGAFDGVHRGHQAVLGRVLREARSLALPAVVIVFEPLPREYLHPEEAPARLMDFREKFQALAALGVDRLLRIRFDETVRTMSAAAFAERIFVDGLGVKRLVLGDDFRFGRGREGDYDFLREQGERHGFDTLSTDTLALDGDRVSSTRVREALAEGDLELAAELLGRPYVITGRVVHGRTPGAPTANVELNRLKAPLSGVFTVRVNGGGLFEAPGVANVGTRPTVNDGSRANLEVHLLEGEPELYGRRIDVQFLHRLRPELKFDTLEDLKEAIHGDFAAAREWFAARTMDRYDA
jgi:riboflavin kinase/FMN adenylyltransferase